MIRWLAREAPGPVFLAALIAVFQPAAIRHGNAFRMTWPLFKLLPVLLLVGAVLAVLLCLPVLFLRNYPRLKRGYGALTVAASLTFWLWGSFVHSTWERFGVLDGHLDLSGKTLAADLQLAGLLLGAAFGLLLALAARFPAAAGHFVLFLGGLSALATAGYTASSLIKRDSGVLLTHDFSEHFYELSAERNVLVVLLDSFQSEYFGQIAARRGDIAGALDGFTWYRDAASVAPSTVLALPAIHSGKLYAPGAPLEAYVKDTVDHHSVLSHLARAGYSVLTVNALVACPNDTEGCFEQGRLVHGDARSLLGEAAQLLDLSLYRVAPLHVKRWLYNQTRWRLKALFVEPDGVLASQVLRKLTERMTVSSRKPVLRFIHSFATHAPAHLRADCSVEVRDWTAASAADQAECALASLTPLLAKLEAEGIYDKTAIVVLGDHGAALPSSRVPAGSAPGFAQMVGAANPLLLYKAPGARGGLRTSDAPVQITDVAGTLCAGEVACVERFGPGLSAWAEGARRERFFQLYDWNGNWVSHEPLHVDMQVIDGALSDPAAWHTASNAAVRLPEALEFSRDEPREAYGQGWSDFETAGVATVRWAEGIRSQVRMQLPVGRAFALRARLGVLDACPGQTLGVAVNGHRLGTRGVRGWMQDSVFAVPPGAALPGANAVVFEFGRTCQAGSGDTRALAAVFDRLDVVDESAGAAAREPASAEASLPDRLDFGAQDPPAAYGEGWSAFETAEGRSVRWAEGHRAQLFLSLPQKSAFRLRLRLGVLPMPAGQHLELRVNGRPLGSRAVSKWVEEVVFAVPAGVARPGSNAVELLFAETVRGQGGDSRQLAALLDSLAVDRTP